MDEYYTELGNNLEKYFGVSKIEYIDYLFQRLRILIVESRDPVAMAINKIISSDSTKADTEIMKYADDCIYIPSDDPRFFCNLVFLFFLVSRRFRLNRLKKDFILSCDQYSDMVDSVGGNCRVDVEEIRSHFRSAANKNSTFRDLLID